MGRQHNFDGGSYQIRVKGHLDKTWESWFEGMILTVEEIAGSPPSTVITGLIQDQAALHGILERIRDLNLQLLTVSHTEMS